LGVQELADGRKELACLGEKVVNEKEYRSAISAYNHRSSSSSRIVELKLLKQCISVVVGDVDAVMEAASPSSAS
jgi:hypothetical protein